MFSELQTCNLSCNLSCKNIFLFTTLNLKTLKKFFLTLITIVFVLALGTFWFIYLMFTTGNNTEEIDIYIPENTSITRTVDQFNEYGLLKPKFVFKLMIKLYSNYNNKYIFSGNYKLKVGQPNIEVLTMLFNGGYDLTVKVTIPEGSNLAEINKIILKKIVVDSLKYTQLISSDSIKKEFGCLSGNLEGYILPETYFFYKYSTPEFIINKLIKEQNKFWNKLNLQPQFEINNISFNKKKLITLASIVEAETPLSSEAPIVAGLYLNRLYIGMLLQSDPTVQYAHGSKNRLLFKDLEINSRYNTYKFAGLPPGPINSPGKNAIESVLNYESHNYIYMVAYGDGSGKHRFSTNLSNHNSNVALYRKAKRQKNL